MDESRDEICYGALLNAQAKPLGDRNLSRQLTAAQSAASFISFSLQYSDGIIELCSDQGVKFAVLDVQTTTKLQVLSRVTGTRSEAMIEIGTLMKRRQKGTPFELSINVFGPKIVASEVSLALTEVGAFLQHPHALDANIEYYNPDILTFPGLVVNMKDCIGMSTPSWQTDSLKRDIEDILGSLGNVVNNDEVRPIPGLRSTLTKHQEDGMQFIMQREDQALSRKLSARICRATETHHIEDAGTSLALGGLVADVMGLGKTLTTLVSILWSTARASDFGYFNHQVQSVGVETVPTKATLVVVPSVQILESWETEIQTHFLAGTLQHMRFHGQNRPQNTEALRKYDIVFTTYATLAADYTGQALLFCMEWYRVVLDEAHWIRKSSSKQFKAAAGLSTRRRWCLTGTPIQNKLEDLASLAHFLQLPPVSSKKLFHKHILKPLWESQVDSSKPLRAYMESYCLRRTEVCLSLPDSHERFIHLSLSPSERETYDRVLDNTRRQIDGLVSTGEKGRYNKVFTALLRMRMVCNMGTFPLTGALGSLRSSSRLGPSSGLKHDCERCSATDEDTIMLLSTCEVCPDCMRPLHQRSPSPLPHTTPSQDSQAENTGSVFDGNTMSFGTDANPYQQDCFSTKLAAVVHNVTNTSNSENKAIVLSYWKTTLHVLAHLLSRAGVKYLQVDGDTSYADRSHRLKDFKEKPDVQVLIMTIETGAVGLNLTVANQVHIVEPQWNPSVEEQAIARAVRMGQTREVTVFRYVLQNTVEQNVVKRQRKKSGLAKFTLAASSDQKVSDTLQELEDVLDLRPRKRTASEL